MIKCPNCGSTAQLELLDSTYIEDGYHLTIERLYVCGCGRSFLTATDYTADGCEVITNEKM